MKLLFITNSRIGDAVLSTGLLAHLIRSHPGLRVTVACGPVAAPLFQGVPGLETLHAMRKQPRAGHWRTLWAATVGTRWDLLVDLRGSPLPWLLRARRRLIPRADRSALDHRVRQIGSALGPAGFANPPPPVLWIRPEDEAAADAILGPDTGRPLLVLAPTANWAGKVWPAERFVRVAQDLTGPNGPLPGVRVAVVAAPNERPAAQPVLDALDGPLLIDLIGHLDLLGVQAVLRRASLFVGNDSGLMHMAAAAGAPTLGLFGPSRDAHYAPWGPFCRAVRTDEPYDVLFPPDLDPRTVESSLLDSLPVERVTAAARALLNDVASLRAPSGTR
ncbi:glycosyltransferase family 9 protein [Roseospira marina]|uniref:Glycosyltransferase family 9 protein n=1 Tax=Roseospira marina TaxID=140057 RepID=A0A5M6IFK8_9PROT|nr:glycosyltransferase family 9 protein [Roseospira marina]KAA5607086.1 glycosyltransferase family 9 protein [Roseospira marina]MBB4312721.1 ADP-heptose:LPS heptosyltransferase [Roseospira marina]MBB5086506.1 ADP-heptose:LPS heptosyltransferase [Roseospira marina]